MAEDKEDISPVDVERDEEEGYQPPPEKSIDEILQADQVLGTASSPSSCCGLDMRRKTTCCKKHFAFPCPKPFPALTCPVMPYTALPWHILSILPCPVMPCLALHGIFRRTSPSRSTRPPCWAGQ